MVSIILDTDPGVDDVLAILLALRSTNVDLKLISLCFGNCYLKDSLRNVLSTLYVLQLEAKHRNVPYSSLVASVPKISIGLATALDGKQLDATDIHGADGLGNVHTSAPEFTCPKEWIDLFSKDSPQSNLDVPFVPSTNSAPEDMLQVLRTEPEGTVVICAIGPLTNVAKAAEIDPAAFSRVKQIVTMGAAVHHVGNVTPLAEFNVFSDPIAAARIYALTSDDAAWTLPPDSPHSLTTYTKPLSVVVFPLDTTTYHVLQEADFLQEFATADSKSPLVKWLSTWMETAYNTFRDVTKPDVPHHFELHDPLALYYCISNHKDWPVSDNVDLRVETSGQWSRGHTIVDARDRRKHDKLMPNDFHKWLVKGKGNRVSIGRDCPNKASFGLELIQSIIK